MWMFPGKYNWNGKTWNVFILSIKYLLGSPKLSHNLKKAIFSFLLWQFLDDDNEYELTKCAHYITEIYESFNYDEQ